MNATTKFAGFTISLAAVFGIAVGIGALVGPEPAAPTRHENQQTCDSGHGAPEALRELGASR